MKNMKKLIFIISSISILVGCSQFVEPDEIFQDEIVTEGDFAGTRLPEVLYASMADDDDVQTRTFVDEKRVLWHRGDAISYYAGQNGNVKYAMKEGQYDGTVSAEFIQAGNPQYEYIEDPGHLPGYNHIPHYSLGVYPYNEDQVAKYYADTQTYHLYTNYSASQTYSVNSFGKNANLMIATGDSANDSSLHFRNACGYLIIKLYGTSTRVTSITLSALNEDQRISGDAIITVNQDADFQISLDNTSTGSVTLDCSAGGKGVLLGESEENATEFWFALPPVTIEGGFQVTITDADGLTYTQQTTKDIVINRNEVKPMKAFAIGITAPTPSQIWYTQADGVTTPIVFSVTQPFDAAISRHYYNEDKNLFIIEFKNPVKVIKKNAFLDNTNILDLTLPHGLETIEEYAFASSSEDAQTSSLRSINIPGTVNLIDNNVFCYNNSLKSITFEPSPNNTPLKIGYLSFIFSDNRGPFWYTDLDRLEINRAFDYPYTKSDSNDGLFSGADADDIIMGEQLTEIYDYMFSSFVSRNPLVISDSIKKIGKYAFYDSSFDKVHISKNVELIDKNAFGECQLNELVIEDSDKTLYLDAYKTTFSEYGQFYDTQLSKIYLGRNVEYISDFIPDENDEGIFALDTDVTDDNPDFRTSVTIGPKVTSLSYRMFCDCPIESITIPGGVNTINNRAFEGCEFLKSVTFAPSSTIDPATGKPTKLVLGYIDNTNQKSIFSEAPIEDVYIDREISYVLEVNGELDQDDEGIFGESETIKSVTFGPQAESISPFMFADSVLPSITIPNTITSIGYNAFRFCEQLRNVNFENGPKVLKIGYQLYNGEEWGPFYDSPMETIHAGREMDYRDDKGNPFTADEFDEGIFSYKYWVHGSGVHPVDFRTTLTIGPDIKTISAYMFSSLSMNIITIPKSVTSIGTCAFYYCSQLLRIFLRAPEPPVLGEKVFGACFYLDRIYVPYGCIDSYSTNPSWKSVASQWGILWLDWDAENAPDRK